MASTPPATSTRPGAASSCSLSRCAAGSRRSCRGSTSRSAPRCTPSRTASHTYRTADGMRITTVLNWIDLVSGHYDEARDGPGHRAELDRCWDASDPTIHRNHDLAVQAATDLLAAALDPALPRDAKIQQFDAVTARYLAYQPGCSSDNQWCNPTEAHVTNS